jgi:hypothetical protein
MSLLRFLYFNFSIIIIIIIIIIPLFPIQNLNLGVLVARGVTS